MLSTCFPFIGGIVSGIALHTVAALRWERLVDFLQSVEEQLEHLHLEDISADQEEIVTEVLERVIRERSKEKSDCYRRIFLNAVSDESLEYGEVIEKVKLVEATYSKPHQTTICSPATQEKLMRIWAAKSLKERPITTKVLKPFF